MERDWVGFGGEQVVFLCTESHIRRRDEIQTDIGAQRCLFVWVQQTERTWQQRPALTTPSHLRTWWYIITLPWMLICIRSTHHFIQYVNYYWPDVNGTFKWHGQAVKVIFLTRTLSVVHGSCIQARQEIKIKQAIHRYPTFAFSISWFACGRAKTLALRLQARHQLDSSGLRCHVV